MPELMADIICRILGFKLQDLIFLCIPLQKNQKEKPSTGLYKNGDKWLKHRFCYWEIKPYTLDTAY
jgi:hypothetical protein